MTKGKGSLLNGFGVHWEVDEVIIVLKSKRIEGGPSSWLRGLERVSLG